MTLDIIDLLDKNPLTRLNKDYHGKFIDKIKRNFTETQQQIFVGSFYCYLNYNSKIDFLVDLDNVWKWLGFARKDFCKKVLVKHFKLNVDYKIITGSGQEKAASSIEEAVSIKNGGCNKETILMNINTFKKLCLKSNTKKADEIHDYFIKLEETFQEIINEESDELKLQLQQKDDQLSIANEMIKKKEEIVYEEVETDEALYAFSTDKYGVYKVGMTTRSVKKRVDDLQTGCVDDIQILFEFKTWNARILEESVHLILDRYRVNSNREHFRCDLDFIKRIIETIGTTLNVLKSMFHSISKEDYYTKLKENLSFIDIENGINQIKYENIDIENQKAHIQEMERLSKEEEIKNLDLKIQQQKTIQMKLDFDNREIINRIQVEDSIVLDTPFVSFTFPTILTKTFAESQDENNRFNRWLILNIRENTLDKVVRFKDLMKTYYDYDFNNNSHVLTVYKKMIEAFIKRKFSHLKCELSRFTNNGSDTRGWRGISLV